jgi:hypothetical protein
MSTYSSNLGTNLITTGDLAGTWGDVTNTNLGTLMEQAISSYCTQQFNNADVTLLMANGADATTSIPGVIYTAGTVAVPVSARNMYIECQGASFGNNLIVPTNRKLYFVYNNITSGGGAITVKTAAGTGVSVPVGARYILACNGTNIVNATTSNLSGTTNYVPKFNSSSTVTNSLIQDDGTNVSIGTTTANGLRVTGNITAYYSDDRLKVRKGNIENALEKVLSLDGFYYEANDTAQLLGYQAKPEVGVSAQQVQAVLPEVVDPAPIDEKFLTVHYERLIPLLIEAIKEQNKKIEALEAKVCAKSED